MNKVEALIIGDIIKLERGVRSTEKMIVVDTVNCSKKRVHVDRYQHSSHNSSTFASFASLSSSSSSTPINISNRLTGQLSNRRLRKTILLQAIKRKSNLELSNIVNNRMIESPVIIYKKTKKHETR